MRKLIAIALAFVLGIASLSLAQVSLNPRIEILHVLGKGVAISSTNSNDFKLLKIGVARVIVGLAGNETEVSVGILHLDTDAYRLRNIQVSNGTATAAIYSNETMVGSLSLMSTTKGDHLLWFGTITINNQSWNVYVLESERKVKPQEAAEKIENLCRDFPERCADVARGIGKGFCEKVGDRSCREKIREFCEKNPTDRRCMAVFRSFCKENLEDERCRKELKEFCHENPTDEKCTNFCARYPRVCGPTPMTTPTNNRTTSLETNTTTSSSVNRTGNDTG